MKSKVFVFLAVFLIAFVALPESQAFTAGGGGNIPGGVGKKRELMVSRLVFLLKEVLSSYFLHVHHLKFVFLL